MPYLFRSPRPLPKTRARVALAIAVTFALLGLTALPVAAQTPAPGYVMGTVATDIPAVMVHRMEPLTQYLAQQLQLPIQLRPAPNMNWAINDFGSGVTQIAYLTPVAFLEARERFGAIAVALPLTEGKPHFRLAVVVLKDSPVKKLQDLVGRSFAFGDEKSLLQRATLEAGGLKLEQFSRFSYLRHFDNVAKALLNHDFDAGIMKESLAHHYAARGLRIIHTSPPLPTYVIAVNSKFPAEKIAALRAALLALDPTIKEHRAILTTLDPGYTGFVPAVDRHFEATQKLIAPFKKPPTPVAP